jgi:OmpA-OmpF porin, OOP family
MRLTRVLTLGVLVASVSSSAFAQGALDRLRQKARERADEKVDRLTDKALDTVECVVGDDDCVAEAKKDGKAVVVTDEDGKPLPASKQPKAGAAPTRASASAEEPAAQDPPAEAAKPGDAAWANFDFVPGERVLFADDFSKDRVGNFPQRLELARGNLEIVESAGKRWVRSTSLEGEVGIPLPEVLPQKFTMEFDFTFSDNFPIEVYPAAKFTEEELGSGTPISHVFLGPFSVGLHAGGRHLVESSPKIGGKSGNDLIGRPARARIHVDGKYVKVYINETRIANAPNGDLARANKIFIRMPGNEDTAVMIGNISVNAGGKSMYDAIMGAGRVATQGIFFDTGSDRIRPESTPTLREIGEMLKAHADLKLAVEGHTDNTGTAAANQSLSEKRAQAIVAYLKAEYGVAAERLQAKGLGQTRPAASNDTAEGRQQNRRVELVKQ